ncbi:MAG: putative DNA binding CopG/RHH family protein [Arcticibacterium sp.]|jgi:predicted DNA binding CopG/RHH family protein
MRNNSNVFLGAILVAVGAFFLAFNYDLFDFEYSFRTIAKFWPILLILAGVAVLLHEKKSFYNPTTALLVAFAIPLGIYSAASDGVDEISGEFKDNFHLDWDQDEDWDDSDRKGYNEGSDAVKKGKRTEQKFSVPMTNGLEEASLSFGGGAAEFHLKKSKNDLFEATTLLNIGNYRLSDELTNNRHEIDFEMKSRQNKNFNFSDNDHNEIFLELSTKPIWSIDMSIGAGDLDFDLSGFKVKNLDIHTGAASVDVKLGDKLKKVSVQVESGVAKVEISVPENVGCEIEMDGALNSKDFDNFQKKDNSTWRTADFTKADKKIYIKISSALTAVSVNRY